MRSFILIVMLAGLLGCSSRTNTPVNPVKTDTLISRDNSAMAPVQSDSIRKYSEKMKRFFMDVWPSEYADKWLLPFDLPNRSDITQVQLISGYGTYRSGHQKGHRHAGIDIVPAIRMDSILVYPANKGRICLIRPAAPNKTIIIRHKLKDGSFIYSAYTHLKDIYVQNGQEVDYTTKMGVLYTKSEARKFNGDYDHLHFEIKKRIDDYCCASWLCMSPEELNEYFDNPWGFLKKNLKQ